MKNISEKIKLIFTLYWAFFKMGLFTFGGGLTMLPLLEKTLVEEKKWITTEEILDYYAISQTTPGVIAVNVATFVGYKKCGIIGGIFATLGVISPSLIIITLIAEFISNFEDIAWVQKALKGINVTVAALLTSISVNLCKKSIKYWWCAVIFMLSFISMYFFHVHALILTFSSCIAGAIIHVLKTHAGENKK